MELQEEPQKFDLDNYSDFKKSMYIEASAGTGKTYTITKIIEKLIEEKVDLEKILVVTYTEKAAGELRDRIRKECPDKDVDNAPIFTIHSFCQKTLSEFYFTANQCANLSLIEDTAVEDFIDHWIRDDLKNDPEFQNLFNDSAKDSKLINDLKRDFKQALSMYYLDKEGKEDKSIVSLEPINFFNFKLDQKKVFNKNTEQILNCNDFEKIIHFTSIEDFFIIDGFEAAWENLEKQIQATNLQTIKSKSEKTKAIRTIEFRKDILSNLSKEHKFSFNGNMFQNRYMEENVKNAFDYLKTFKESWTEAAEKAQTLLCHIFYNSHIQKLYLAWQNEKERNKSQNYDDMLRSVREAVYEENSALKKQLQKKYTYAIIDEFQDTDQKQWDIFNKVFMEDKEHTIIVVGDPKQSIYAFHGADVKIYTKAINSIAANGGAAYSLKKNYRSTDAMVKACNSLFASNFFTSGSNITFEDSDTSGKKNPAKYEGKDIKPFWIAGNPKENKTVTEQEFAKITVQKIVDCCSFKNGKTNLQVSDKDSEDGLRNVSFHDFAILVRSSSELKETEKALKKAGIPFLRYKDANLFSGKECLYWIALINAITAKDFTSTNRNILNEALNSDFFCISLNNVNDEKYANPSCPERQLIIQWQQLAQKRKWAKLFERIFADTDIENRLSSLDQLQSLSKIRQIGNYALDYLYKNDCSLEDVSKHLLRLSKDSESSMDEGDIVEKGTDFDCVQLMTIHASKGLEFPVVIVPAGLRARNNNVAQAFLYHDGNDNSKLSFSPYGKDISQIEEDYERERIFYVAYTRASSLLILPYYDVWVPEKDNNDKDKETEKTKMYKFLKDSISSLFDGADGQEYCKPIEAKNISDVDLQKDVQALLEENKKLKEKENGTRLKEESSETDQLQATKELSKKSPSLSTYKHCYSNLFHKKSENEEMTADGGRADKEDSGEQNDSLAEFDRAENPVSYIAVPGSQAACPPAVEAPSTYPCGTRLGQAVHEVFEKADFGTGKTDEGLEELIRACFEKQTLSIPSKGTNMDSEGWLDYTCTLIWNTFNARLPEISGNAPTGNYFSLNELSAEDKISEAEFNMKLSNQESPFLKNYCNGFVDLVFKHTVNGKDLYSVLDWKSDTLEPDQYSDGTQIIKRTDDKYSIQRVLYSYCLIKWLASFYKDKSEEEIFENHFGGIYYVYVRGCHPGTCSGIYARTWKSWAELESAFKNIFKKMHIAA